MVKLLKFVFVICLLGFATSCEKENIEAGQILERYFLSTEGAILPVELRGLEASKTAIIFVHGGPGATGILSRQADGLRALENVFKVLYYDQRGSGISQGNVDETTMTVDQFARDLNVVIDFVAQKEGIEKIFLMGQSFGGGLSSYYLSQVLDNRIEGFIAVSPGFELAESLKLSREWVLDIIDQAITNNPSQNLLATKTFYERNSVINVENFVDHLKNVEKLGGLKAAKDPQITTIKDYNLIPHEIAVNLLWVVENLTFNGTNIFESLNLKNELPKVKVPTLLLWGQSDGLVPVQMADVFEANIGTSESDFQQKRYANVAHELFSENSVQVAKDIRNFVQKYE